MCMDLIADLRRGAGQHHDATLRWGLGEEARSVQNILPGNKQLVRVSLCHESSR